MLLAAKVCRTAIGEGFEREWRRTLKVQIYVASSCCLIYPLHASQSSADLGISSVNQAFVTDLTGTFYASLTTRIFFADDLVRKQYLQRTT